MCLTVHYIHRSVLDQIHLAYTPLGYLLASNRTEADQKGCKASVQNVRQLIAVLLYICLLVLLKEINDQAAYKISRGVTDEELWVIPPTLAG